MADAQTPAQTPEQTPAETPEQTPERVPGGAAPGADGWPTEPVPPERLYARCAELRAQGYNQLADLSALDWPGRQGGRFDVIVHLRAIPDGRHMRLVCGTDGRVPSLVALWPAAEWAEREVFDLFGVIFDGHPDLRRILLPEDWEGHPLRRDYPLRGPRELDPESKYAV